MRRALGPPGLEPHTAASEGQEKEVKAGGWLGQSSCQETGGPGLPCQLPLLLCGGHPVLDQLVFGWGCGRPLPHTNGGPTRGASREACRGLLLDAEPT